MDFPHSVGLLYSSFTYYLGFAVNSGEYKLMGLAPYGNPEAEETRNFISLIKNNLVDIKEDGSIWLNQRYFKYTTGLRMANDKKWKNLFGFSRRIESEEIEQTHCNLAFAIQNVTEEIVTKMAMEAKKITNAEYLCMAGGVALNCVANGKLLKEKIFKRIYIQPAAGDAGAALGAALATHYICFDEYREIQEPDAMKGSYLGPSFTSKEIEKMCRKVNAVYKAYNSSGDLCKLIASKLAYGKIVGRFSGRMEFGPRALGNRSILANPKAQEMQKKLNLKIKYRESFRPFAPAVIEERLGEYFEMVDISPYMLFTGSVKEDLKKPVPADYNFLPLLERLYMDKSALPAVTHIDFSARIQTVSKETNSPFWKLLHEFEKQTGCAVLVNTSFNVRGEPIVCTPYDAYRCFMSTEIDYLVVENFVFYKQDQPDWENKQKWVKKFKSD